MPLWTVHNGYRGEASPINQHTRINDVVHEMFSRRYLPISRTNARSAIITGITCCR
jgi:hypothetical protein